ncbi:uncharacterized protein LOC127802301 isoform X2 [Diospyros lotus]|uniref:uncharacterized protein LOC127802301 isoform X2 n=1 Tax=Diospyros lotus TaxID=55363 RepID=UPI002253374D|nr:uncharacterized protein LOC127802301 isoform X2 [Diospyros lotus]
MSKLFGGRNPFDDPFFTRPFGAMFGTHTQSGHRSREVTIEEVDSDGNPLNHSEPSKELAAKNANIDDPIENQNGKKSLSFQRVSYGGLNGMYYTASVTKKTGDDGVFLMEIKEEDKTVGQTLDTVSRGIHDKGHSVTKKWTLDGNLDAVQTLHNLNEDELVGFEETWKSSSHNLPPDWNTGFSLLDYAGDDAILVEVGPSWKGDFGFKLGFITHSEKMMFEKMLGYTFKANPHIGSRIK